MKYKITDKEDWSTTVSSKTKANWSMSIQFLYLNAYREKGKQKYI